MDTKGITLKPEFEKAIMELGFSEFTEIQEKCIPLIQQGKDVIGLSYTGSGKTAAFGFPALEKVIHQKGIQLLVVVPTRELCNQVAKELRKFTKYKKTEIVQVYGGISINPQIDDLRHADVVVGTPGRILDHLARKTLNVDRVKILVLDEADKMFEIGFIDDLKKIISKVTKNSQKLFFSATMPHEIMEIVKNYINNQERVKMQSYVDKSKLMQHYYDVDRHNKFSLLVHVIKTDLRGLVLVFCATRRTVDIINKNVNLIINYDLPKTSREYVHRIGRTARAGEEGKVVSLLSSDDYDNFTKILEDRSLLIHKMKLPDFKRVEFILPQRHRSSFHRNFSRERRRY